MEKKAKIRLNEDAETVRLVREGLKRTGGYCPCRLERTEDTRCICREFREQMADPDFEGTATVCCIIRKRADKKHGRRACRVFCFTGRNRRRTRCRRRQGS